MQSRHLVSLFTIAFSYSVLLFGSSSSWAASTYYIDGRVGNDNNDGLAPESDGTQHGPRRTWKWFSSMDGGGLKPGDQVLFKRGTTISRDDAGINMRCSNMQKIYFGAYGDDTLPDPVLDSCGEMGLHIGYNGPTRGLTFEDLKFITSKPRPQGEIITAYSKVEEGPGYAEGVSFRRIEVDATNETGVEVCDETVTFAADNVTIEDCYIHDGGRTGIYVSGSNNVIQRNRIENFLVGIKLNDNTRQWSIPTRVVVRRNLLINTGISVELGNCHHNDMYSNVTIGTGPSPGEDPRQFGIQIEGIAHDNNVFNNTVILNGQGGDHHGVRMYQEAGSGNFYKNNLVYFHNDGNDQDDHLFFQGQQAKMPNSDFNLYFTDGQKSWYRDGKNYNSLNGWSATAGRPDQHSLFANPRFVTDPAVSVPQSVPIALRTDSPAINGGTPIAMHTKLPFVDYFGKPRSGRPDIGAFERQE